MRNTKVFVLVIIAIPGFSTGGLSDAIPTFAERVEAHATALRKLDSDSSHNPAWLSSTSPWAEFIGSRLEENLSASERTTSRKLVETGQCEANARLLERGFIRRHPQLDRAFTKKSVVGIFRHKILPGVSHSDRRCRALRIISPLTELARKLGANVYEVQVAAGVGQTSHATESSNISRDEKALSRATDTLEWLAICHLYRPALSDLAHMAVQLQWQTTGGIHGYYLRRLILATNVEGKLDLPPLDETRPNRPNNWDPATMAKIRFYFEQYTPREASARLWFQRMACAAPPQALPLH